MLHFRTVPTVMSVTAICGRSTCLASVRKSALAGSLSTQLHRSCGLPVPWPMTPDELCPPQESWASVNPSKSTAKDPAAKILLLVTAGHFICSTSVRSNFNESGVFAVRTSFSPLQHSWSYLNLDVSNGSLVDAGCMKIESCRSAATPDLNALYLVFFDIPMSRGPRRTPVLGAMGWWCPDIPIPRCHNICHAHTPLILLRRAKRCESAMTHTGRHFLQIPGPTNVPDRVLRAMDR